MQNGNYSKKMELKYDITESGCWRCTSHRTNSHGYVKLTVDNKQYYGHRYMFIKAKGHIKDEVIRHTCDNRWCINPSHLIGGSQNDNVQDRVLRHRSAIGERNGRSKLIESEVIEIFKDNKTPNSILANMFNVDPKVIRDIKQGKKWRHVTNNV